MARPDPAEAATTPAPHEESTVWPAVDRLLERLTADTAHAHGVTPLFARKLRTRGDAVPETLLQEEKAAKMKNLIAPQVLARARAAYDGPMLVLKGTEVAALYPGRARMLVDLDVLVPDAAAAREGLLASGFVRAERVKEVSPAFYHLSALELPGLPLPIELHKNFRSPLGLSSPPNEALFEAAVPASANVPGLLAPAPAHHAILLAGHAWAEHPLERLRDFIDVAVMAAKVDAHELSRTAAEWGWTRVWRTTERTIDWLFGDGPKPRATRILARHLDSLREPTSSELRLRHWLSPFWAARPPTALHVVAYLAKRAVLGRGRS
jgi:hypothetical protein